MRFALVCARAASRASSARGMGDKKGRRDKCNALGWYGPSVAALAQRRRGTHSGWGIREG